MLANSVPPVTVLSTLSSPVRTQNGVETLLVLSAGHSTVWSVAGTSVMSARGHSLASQLSEWFPVVSGGQLCAVFFPLKLTLLSDLASRLGAAVC